MTKILVYGSGPLGSLFAARLQQGGNDVSILARGQRLAELREHGIVLVDVQTKERDRHPGEGRRRAGARRRLRSGAGHHAQEPRAADPARAGGEPAHAQRPVPDEQRRRARGAGRGAGPGAGADRLSQLGRLPRGPRRPLPDRHRGRQGLRALWRGGWPHHGADSSRSPASSRARRALGPRSAPTWTPGSSTTWRCCSPRWRRPCTPPASTTTGWRAPATWSCWPSGPCARRFACCAHWACRSRRRNSG